MNTPADTVKELIGSAVSSCLCRIAGGGETNRPRPSKSAADDEWLEKLKAIAISSVSLPNGDARSIGGKPHDVEVRAALALYHRVRAGNSAQPKPIELISDMGTVRSFDSPQSFAKLLAAELEQELLRCAIQFASIRQGSTGIICLVSKRRADQLAAADRLPCPHCLQWFKGEKGLWWHQLAAHR